jgi:hypothetical protein
MQDLAAVVLGIPAVASHCSAGWMDDLVEAPPPVPEVTAPRSTAHRSDGVRLHRTDDLLRRDT